MGQNVMTFLTPNYVGHKSHVLICSTQLRLTQFYLVFFLVSLYCFILILYRIYKEDYILFLVRLFLEVCRLDERSHVNSDMFFYDFYCGKSTVALQMLKLTIV